MKSKQTFFFAEAGDWKILMKEIETLYDIQYFKTGMFDSPEISGYKSFFDIPNFGYVQYGDWVLNDDFLIIPTDNNLEIRSVPQKKGGVKFAVDQFINEQSVTLKIGGIFKEGILVAGRLATVSENNFSLDFYKTFSFKIKKAFKKVGVFYVGEKAFNKMQSGWRLVTIEESPREYDLRLN